MDLLGPLAYTAQVQAAALRRQITARLGPQRVARCYQAVKQRQRERLSVDWWEAFVRHNRLA
jgi:hypothetical protein